MDIISNSGANLAKVRSLTEEERALFMVPVSIGTALYNEKQDFLRKVHSHHFWLCCDCNPDRPAIMGVRLKDDIYYVFNINKRGAHLESCQLFRMINIEQGLNSDIERKQTNKNSFVFHSIKKSGLEKNISSEKNTLGGSSTKQSENSLWVCLKRLMMLSEVDKIGGKLPITEFERRQALFKATRLIRVGGMSLSKVFRWGLKKHNEVCEIVTRITEDNSMPKGMAHGVVISIIDGFKVDNSKNVCIYEGDYNVIMPPSCNIEINGKQGYENSPPYLAIYTVVNTSDEGEEIICEPQKCYITPIHSVDSVIPISSEIERGLIDTAIANLTYNSKKGINLIYQKPLSPYIAPISKINVLPTLSAKYGDREIFIDIDYSCKEFDTASIDKRMRAMHEITSVVSVPDGLAENDQKRIFDSIGLAAKHLIGIKYR